MDGKRKAAAFRFLMIGTMANLPSISTVKWNRQAFRYCPLSTLSVNYTACAFKAIEPLSGNRSEEFKDVFWRGVDKAFFDPCGQANNRHSFDGNRLMQLRVLSEYPTSLVRNRYRFAACNLDIRTVALVINPYLLACSVFVHRPQALTSR